MGMNKLGQRIIKVFDYLNGVDRSAVQHTLNRGDMDMLKVSMSR